MDEKILMDFVHKAVGDVGSLLAGSMVVLGDRLGLYRAMVDGEPTTSEQLAAKTATSERYVREWLSAQAAAGYVSYEGDGRYRLAAEHAIALTDETSPWCVVGAFQLALAAVRSTDRLTEAFLTGAGIGWGDHDPDLYPGCERFFRPSYANFLTQQWIPGLGGVQERLCEGIRVADVGCGHGASTMLMAAAYPASSFTGVDAHLESVAAARKRAADAGLTDRVTFEIGGADGLTGRYGLITVFDCLHDMGDPVRACTTFRAALDDDGVLMIVEPRAGDTVEENLNPVGAVYYAASTLLCTPSALSQHASQEGTALGAQAGESRIRDTVNAAGFGRFRRIAETPFNQVFEARI